MKATIQTGDLLEHNRNAAILHFTGKRKVISTGALNGGLRKDLTAVFNYNDTPRAGAYCQMWGDTMEAHQTHVAQELGLDPRYVTGLNTGANIDNAAIQTIQSADYSITALVTAGVEVNACRIGDPAQLDERDGKAQVLGGTINILLIVDADLSDCCMARAMVTVTEAKVAALQELLAVSRYSCGLATGSGTDGTIIVANRESGVHLREAGEQYALGEQIGRLVMKTVKDALYRQTGLCAGMQHSVFRRMERFGVTEAALWERYRTACDLPMDRDVFASLMGKMSADGSVVAFASLYAHLLDQMLWGLLLPQEAAQTGASLLEMMNLHHGMPDAPRIVFCETPQQLVEHMSAAFADTVLHWLMGSTC